MFFEVKPSHVFVRLYISGIALNPPSNVLSGISLSSLSHISVANSEARFHLFQWLCLQLADSDEAQIHISHWYRLKLAFTVNHKW